MNDTTRQKRQNSQHTLLGQVKTFFISLICFLFHLMSHDDKLEGWMFVLMAGAGQIYIYQGTTAFDTDVVILPARNHAQVHAAASLAWGGSLGSCSGGNKRRSRGGSCHTYPGNSCRGGDSCLYCIGWSSCSCDTAQTQLAS